MPDQEPSRTAAALFVNRPPTPEQAQMLDAITAAMTEAGTLLLQLPESRFRSLAMTKLEEASMWAKKATVFTVGVHPEQPRS
jgi:hypothetical protein